MWSYMNEEHQKAIDYIANTGGQPLIEHFDEDHEPIGPQLRLLLTDAGLIHELDGRIYKVVA